MIYYSIPIPNIIILAYYCILLHYCYTSVIFHLFHSKYSFIYFIIPAILFIPRLVSIDFLNLIITAHYFLNSLQGVYFPERAYHYCRDKWIRNYYSFTSLIALFLSKDLKSLTFTLLFRLLKHICSTNLSCFNCFQSAFHLMR